MGVGMLPEEAFGSVPLPTDWVDTTESQRILRYQQRDFDDYIHDMLELVGSKRVWIKTFRPLVRQFLLAKSPYYSRGESVPGRPAPRSVS